VNGSRPAADPLFESVAGQYREQGIAVILSGSLHDGANGAYEIAAAGGRVLVQDRETSLVCGMPLAAIRTGAVHFVLSPEMIARALITLVMAPGAAEWFRVWPKALKRPVHTTPRRPASLV
jgi:two-component system chemotaxis response regulator CheB